MNYHETDDLWRLYRREWVIVHTVTRHGDEDGRPAFEQAREWIAENVTGRVRDSDVRIMLNTDSAEAFWAQIEVFKDNLKGEFKHVEKARLFAAQNGYDEYVTVPRNSKSDHDIRNYGVVKL